MASGNVKFEILVDLFRTKLSRFVDEKSVRFELSLVDSAINTKLYTRSRVSWIDTKLDWYLLAYVCTKVTTQSYLRHKIDEINRWRKTNWNDLNFFFFAKHLHISNEITRNWYSFDELIKIEGTPRGKKWKKIDDKMILDAFMHTVIDTHRQFNLYTCDALTCRKRILIT